MIAPRMLSPYQIVILPSRARKSADFKLDDKINLEIACSPVLSEAVNEHKAKLIAETLTKNFTLLDVSGSPQGDYVEEDVYEPSTKPLLTAGRLSHPDFEPSKIKLPNLKEILDML